MDRAKSVHDEKPQMPEESQKDNFLYDAQHLESPTRARKKKALGIRSPTSPRFLAYTGTFAVIAVSSTVRQFCDGSRTLYQPTQAWNWPTAAPRGPAPPSATARPPLSGARSRKHGRLPGPSSAR